MSNQHQNNSDEKLQARYRSLPNDEPPAELDAHILAVAHQALAKPDKVVVLTPKNRIGWWIRPMAYAAALVLCVGVVLRMQLDAPEVFMPRAESPAPVMSEAADETVSAEPVTVAAPMSSVETASQDRVLPSQEQVAKKKNIATAMPLERDKQEAVPPEEKTFLQKAACAIPVAPAREESFSAMASAPMSLMVSEQPSEQAGAEISATMMAEEISILMQLYREQKHDELKIKLRVFMQAYPQAELPVELREFLQAMNKN